MKTLSYIWKEKYLQIDKKSENQLSLRLALIENIFSTRQNWVFAKLFFLHTRLC